MFCAIILVISNEPVDSSYPCVKNLLIIKNLEISRNENDRVIRSVKKVLCLSIFFKLKLSNKYKIVLVITDKAVKKTIILVKNKIIVEIIS